MPKEKDLKNLVRARMGKTGEGYSIARLHVNGAANGSRTGRPLGFAVAAGKDPLGAPATPVIYQIKITIADIEPAIWRRLQVPSDTTLAELHEIIQAAFGWWNYHLHQYVVDRQHFGVPDPEYADELPPMVHEKGVALRDIVGAAKITYEYDFGDSWEHRIEIESVAVVPESGITYPICIAGARARPPEDCGGTSGYESMLEILADPEHEEYRQTKTWVGRKYDPEKLDLVAVSRALKRVRSQSNAVRQRGSSRGRAVRGGSQSPTGARTR